jgi:rRNA maturation endonuclease Nob1
MGVLIFLRLVANFLIQDKPVEDSAGCTAAFAGKPAPTDECDPCGSRLACESVDAVSQTQSNNFKKQVR